MGGCSSSGVVPEKYAFEDKEDSVVGAATGAQDARPVNGDGKEDDGGSKKGEGEISIPTPRPNYGDDADGGGSGKDEGEISIPTPRPNYGD
jgi:hypothetical protein